MEGKNRVMRRDNNYLHTRSNSSKYPRMRNSHSNNKALSRRRLLRWVFYSCCGVLDVGIAGTCHDARAAGVAGVLYCSSSSWLCSGYLAFLSQGVEFRPCKITITLSLVAIAVA